MAFTREVIKNYSSDLKPRIEIKERKILKAIEDLNLEKVSPKIPSGLEPKPSKPLPKGIPGAGQAMPRQSFRPLPRPFKMPPRLKIPAPQLPQRLRYIQPTAHPGVEIDLGKLNSLVANPVIQTIECNGPDEKVIIRDPGEKATNITLSKGEIDTVIKKFADAARIPVSEGVFRVAVGKLVLSAVVSDVVGSKFIIKKLRYSPAPQGQGMSRLQPAKSFTSQPSRLAR